MTQKTRDTFLMHMNHERMFTTVSPEQCQRLVKAMFKLARTGEVEDMSDDLMLDIFFQQISSFMVNNERHYAEVCEKRREAANQKWDEIRRLQAEEEQRKSGQAQQNNNDPYDLKNVLNGLNF